MENEERMYQNLMGIAYGLTAYSLSPLIELYHRLKQHHGYDINPGQEPVFKITALNVSSKPTNS
jgi:hypothetical protein